MLQDPGTTRLRGQLRTALTDAMKARDRVAVAALRSTLGALDNAEAVEGSAAPAPTSEVIAGAVTGLGAGETARRELSETDAIAIVEHEIRERHDAAKQYESLDQIDHAKRLRAEATILADVLGS